MLAAYYDRKEDTHELFDRFAVSRTATYRTHLNQYDVIKINMQEFISATGDVDEMLAMLQKRLIADLRGLCPTDSDSTQG